MRHQILVRLTLAAAAAGLLMACAGCAAGNGCRGAKSGPVRAAGREVSGRQSRHRRAFGKSAFDGNRLDAFGD